MMTHDTNDATKRTQKLDDTAPQAALPPYPARQRVGPVAWMLVFGGVLAWVVVLTAVLLVVLRGEENDTSTPPDAPPQVIAPPTQGAQDAGTALAEVPRAVTLAAATGTLAVTPTGTPTGTPVPTQTAIPSATATAPPLATATTTMIPILTATSPGVTAEPLVAPESAAESIPLPTRTASLGDTASAAQSAPQSAAQSAPQTVPDIEADAAPDSAAAAESVTVNGCTIPPGWQRYTVQPGDTLFAFALGAGSDDSGALAYTVDDLLAANCLNSRYLRVDQVLYLPPGAAENAPPSEPYVAPGSLAQRGPRPADCPCVISVPAGWRREQLAEAVQNSATSFTGADFLAVTGPDATAPYDFVQQRPPGTSLEGFLFPGTYTVQNDTTAEQFRDMLLDAFAANVSPQMRADAAAQGVSFYEALIIASVVQREVHGPNTQKLVASVYYNNYRAGGRLGSTVTVQYAIGGPGAWWPRVRGSDLENPSPFNTYKHGGLPPAPIDSPGLSAIVAAVYPAQTNYRFHTAACDGSGEVFAETYEQHLANVNCE